MYHRILIDNRADCALELVEACHVCHAEAFVVSARDDDFREISSRADGVVYTGLSRDAYTAQENILEAARHVGCEAVMTGWGFLSEDYQFASRCRQLGIHFIGPTSRQLQIFGDKLKTIHLLAPAFEHHHPVVSCDDPDFDRQIRAIPAPYMLKPRFGGGGKNILELSDISALSEQLSRLKSMNQLRHYMVEHAVSSDERYHIEFQVMGNGRGRVDLIGARDCTPQVNHQKWLERSICLENRPDILKLGQSICRRLAEIHYKSWGTVECLIQENGHVQLLEVNPRLQVEHLVTMMDSNYDLITAAIRCECGENLPELDLSSSDETVEFRLYARGIGCVHGMAGVKSPACGRMVSAYSDGDSISGVYDGLLARYVVCGNHALDELKRWLSLQKIRGVETNCQDLQSFGDFKEIPEIRSLL